MRAGASQDAADRVAAALFPGSLAAAAASGPMLMEALAEVREFVAAGAAGAEEALLPAGEARFLAPTDPRVMRDFMSFEKHIINATRRLGGQPPETVYRLPVSYKGNPTTLLGQDDVVPWPSYTERMDYEMELGFVVGRGGRDLTPEEAVNALLGVTIFNDFSARDIQKEEMGGMLGPAKGKDFATGLGPWIVTLDELDLANLSMTVRVNGEERSNGVSGEMMWSPAELVAWASAGEQLHPGDLIGSGTVGEGCGLELGFFLGPGDTVELEVGGIGVLRNTIGQPEPRRWYPSPRQPSL
ncbi:MAG: fumarylacetoacetate hydrolase family protein [Streptosporangiales bacterium]|nr:fumarylacetoacetate hydrolase family protein [Streptosporangiales bacterium]